MTSKIGIGDGIHRMRQHVRTNARCHIIIPMKELELIITEGAKAGGEAHSVEFGVPIREPVELDGEQFIVLSPRCLTLKQLDDEVRSAIAKLHELRVVAKANFARWDNESKKR